MMIKVKLSLNKRKGSKYEKKYTIFSESKISKRKRKVINALIKFFR